MHFLLKMNVFLNVLRVSTSTLITWQKYIGNEARLNDTLLLNNYPKAVKDIIWIWIYVNHFFKSLFKLNFISFWLYRLPKYKCKDSILYRKLSVGLLDTFCGCNASSDMIWKIRYFCTFLSNFSFQKYPRALARLSVLLFIITLMH